MPSVPLPIRHRLSSRPYPCADDASFGDKAFAARQLADALAKHKSMSFPEKAADRSPIDYAAAVTGNLVLTPSREGLRVLGEDCARMVDDGWLLGGSEPFEQCEQIQARTNKANTSGSENTGE